MSLMPTFVPILPEWRGNSSSEDMNTNFESIIYDLNTIFEEASTQAIDLSEMESVIRYEIDALSARINAVSGVITAFEQAASGYKMFHEDFYKYEDIAFPNTLALEDRCVVETDFGVVTLPVINSFSKVYTISLTDGNVYQAPDLAVSVSPIDETNNTKVEETSPLRAFNGSNASYWERKVRFNRDSTKNEIDCRMTVTLPSMSNPYVNKLFIKPYPEGNFYIDSITYDTLTSQNNVLDTFPTEGIEHANSTLFSFDNIQPTKFKIDFRQGNSHLDEDYKTFVYGAQEIGIEKVEYKASGKFGIKFSVPSYETGLLNKITSLRTDPSYDNIRYKVYLYATDANFQSGIALWSSANSPITVTNQLDVSLYATASIWVMIEMTQGTNNTDSPLFNSVTLTYNTV